MEQFENVLASVGFVLAYAVGQRLTLTKCVILCQGLQGHRPVQQPHVVLVGRVLETKRRRATMQLHRSSVIRATIGIYGFYKGLNMSLVRVEVRALGCLGFGGLGAWGLVSSGFVCRQGGGFRECFGFRVQVLS